MPDRWIGHCNPDAFNDCARLTLWCYAGWVDENTPEPVFKWTTIVPIITALYLAVTEVLVSFDLWTPTDEQQTAIRGLGAPIVLLFGFYAAWKARSQVTPVSQVALTKADAQLLDAAQGPPMFITPAHPGGNPDV